MADDQSPCLTRWVFPDGLGVKLGDCPQIKPQVEAVDGWLSDGATGGLFKRGSLMAVYEIPGKDYSQAFQ